MSLDELTQAGLIHEFEDVSAGPHSSKFCFVLGAGASKTSGIKTGQELVDIWEKEMCERNEPAFLKWKNENGIEEKNKYSFYSQYYEERYRKRPMDGLNFLEKMMEHVNPNVGYVVLAHLLARTVHNVVITTNFDHLLEDALNYYEKALPLVIGHESLAHYITKQIARPTIIKIHRDLLLDPKNTVKDVGDLHEEWKKALDIIFSEFHPIFIGYAGNDRSLMDYLIENTEKFNSGEWKFPYWTLYKSNIIPEGKVKDFLGNVDGYYINCSGFDELMCLMGAEVGYRMPEEDQFLEDTRTRYRQLLESFENYVPLSNSAEKQEEYTSADGNEAEGQRTLGAAVRQITPDTEYKRAVALHNEKKYNEAAAAEKELISQEPENTRYHRLLWQTLYAMGELEKAEETARKLIRLESGNAGFYIDLSMTLRERDKDAEAAAQAEKAIGLDPQNARCHASLGRTLHKMGRDKEAKEALETAVRLAPENDFYKKDLEEVLQKLK